MKSAINYTLPEAIVASLRQDGSKGFSAAQYTTKNGQATGHMQWVISLHSHAAHIQEHLWKGEYYRRVKFPQPHSNCNNHSVWE